MGQKSIAKKMSERAVGNLFNNTMMGKIGLFVATVERHNHDMMRTNKLYKNVVHPGTNQLCWPNRLSK